MKYYLSSFKLNLNSENLSTLYNKNKRVGVILNALDLIEDQESLKERQKQEFAELKKSGLEPEFIDLKDYFDNQEGLSDLINSLGGLWVTGGNTFVLRRAYLYSGLDKILLNLNNKDFVYAGYSAGICVLTPYLKGIDLCDDPNQVPEKYSKETIWHGLGLIPFSLVPHYRSDHPESKLLEECVEYFIQNHIPFIALKDGQVLIMD